MDISSIILNLYNSIVEYMQGKADALIAEGQDLALILILISIAWVLITWMLSGDGTEALMDTFSVVLRYSIVTLFLAGWLSTVGGFLQASVNDIAQKVTGTNSVGESVYILAGAAKSIFVSTNIQDRASRCEVIKANNPVTGDLEEQIVCDDSSAISFTDVVFNLPVILFTYLFKLLALVFVILMVASFLLAILMAEVLFGIALTIGPILVPWLVWRQTEWLFNGWLRFILSACFTKIIAFFMVGVVGGIISAIKEGTEHLNTGNGSDILAINEMAALVICLASAMGTFLMWQASGIASGLLSGSGGASASGFGRGFIARTISSSIR